ncbi:phosphoenolpyruvate carboxykinase (ATP) [Ancylobacter polymorphus]|uniref:phosphoenolpyruvate carboxykinase (ATP) n=1 Tax=Ancylobacter polymorphus TaxID=223390 RepID=A0A9E7A282_9HYPH|nr:phosphoenolpyruvate carboxykinase (ATP) [Ancylobacter polymorphus]UOK71845.1 phosphoenolpyruvate carboxykinase (ATP) [Ancylobacter polymorphus]
MNQTGTQSDHSGLEGLDPAGTGRVFWNLGSAYLCERAVARGEVRLSHTGALVVTTGTAGQPLALARVDDAAEGGETAGATDASALTRAQFEALKADLLAYVARRTLFGQDVSVEAGPAGGIAVRILSDQAWHALVARHLLRPRATAADADVPRLTVLCAPGFRPTPETHGVAAEGALALDLANGLALIAGTGRGETLRAALAHLLAEPLLAAGVLPLEGAARTGADGAISLLLGASGAGKSALAQGMAEEDGALPRLDGALGWGDEGLVALEAGTFAHPADLATAPEAARFGTVLENIALDPATRVPDFDATGTGARIILPTATAHAPTLGAPAHLFMLVQDEEGVLPALARLSAAQTPGAFLEATGLAAPHLARLHTLLERHTPVCWLVNTGRTGGDAERRVPLEVSRRLVAAAQMGELASGEWRTDPHLGLHVPAAVEGIDPALLDPARGWANRGDYLAAARRWTQRLAAPLADKEIASGTVATPGMAVAAE